MWAGGLTILLYRVATTNLPSRTCCNLELRKPVIKLLVFDTFENHRLDITDIKRQGQEYRVPTTGDCKTQVKKSGGPYGEIGYQ